MSLAQMFVMCEHRCMQTPPEAAALTGDPLNISRSYAWEIVNGTRSPSRELAIRIYRETGWKHTVIAALTDAQIDVLESIAPKVAA